MTPEKLQNWYAKVCKVGYTGDKFEIWNDQRETAKRDLFWLAKDILGYDLVDNFYCPAHPLCQSKIPATCSLCGQALKIYPGSVFFNNEKSLHRAICEFFVQKKPDLLISEQDEVKNRLLMVPRGGLKSSIDEADCTQWMIAFPDVRIALLTAAEDLAETFVANTRRSFLVAETENEEKQYTKFQLLFPEHCAKESDKGPRDRFITPGRENKKIKEPSLHAISLQKTTSGWHYDIGKYDDVVSNKNSGHSTTPEQRDNVRKDIGLARSVVEPYGFHDNIGTSYADDDAYAYQIATSDPENFKMMVHPAWELKPEAVKKKAAEPFYKFSESDYELILPFIIKQGKIEPRLSYKFLKSASADVENFPCFPAGCVILLADLTEKPIEQIQVGDEIVGVQLGGVRKFIKSTVEHIHSEESEVYKITTNIGRILYTTPEHQFLRQGKDRYGVLKNGTKLVSAYHLWEPESLQDKLDWAWLGGIIDGEGSCSTGCVQIIQSTHKNPEVCSKIEKTLDRLNISYRILEQKEHGIHMSARTYTLHGGRSLKLSLLKYGEMAKKARFLKNFWNRPCRISENGLKSEAVTTIESVGRQTVYNIQSSSGNFICQGIAVKNCQYLCKPNALRLVKFTDLLLRSHTVKSEGLPQEGTFQRIMAWDFAYSDEKGRDFSVGTVGWFCLSGPLAGKVFIVDMVRGRFSKSELATNVARLATKWRVEKIGIENSSGANFLENDIMREAHRMGFHDCPTPEWFPVDSNKNAKNSRAEGLETLLISDRLYFSADIPILDDVIKEFVNFKPGTKRKDDSVDSVAHCCRYLPARIEIPQTEQERNKAVHDLLVQKHIDELIFIAPPKQEAPPPPIPTEIDGMMIFSNYEQQIYGN